MPDASCAYYVRSAKYGEPGHMARKMDGTPMEGHRGGFVACPRCGGVLSVAQEQLEHTGDPHSVAHVSDRIDVINAEGRNVRCGAHFVFGDPEMPVDGPYVPVELKGLVENDPLFRGRQVYVRPITWHGDV